MEELIRQIAAAIATYFSAYEKIIDPKKRIPTSIILGALQSTRDLIHHHFGGPIRFRCAKSKAGNLNQCEQEGFGVLEYLVDFSFSKFSIPQAIGDPNAPQDIQPIAYQLVFAAESELGTPNEVCRDLLKLLDVRSSIRCLLFERRIQQPDADQLKTRMLNVLRNHALIEDTMSGWLFIALDVQDGKVVCYFYTLGNNLDDLVTIEIEA